MRKAIKTAAKIYLERKYRISHPAGRMDNAKRFIPNDKERRGCCARIRQPSRAWPHTLMLHCRTAGHVAEIYEVKPTEVRKAAKQIEDDFLDEFHLRNSDEEE